MGFSSTKAAATAATAALLVVAAAAMPSIAAGAVSAGHSGWKWADPLPQGHSLQALELSGSLGYAAGDFGTLLRTDDSGTTWTALATGVTTDLNRVAIVDENSVVVAGGCTVRRSDDAGVTFARLPWTPSDARCAAPVAAIAFPSEQRGYLVLGDGTVYRTIDGGLAWSRAADLPAGRRPRRQADRRRVHLGSTTGSRRPPPARCTARATEAPPGRSPISRRTAFAASTSSAS